MKRLIFVLLLVAAGAAFFTNPEKEAHKAAMKQAISEATGETLRNELGNVGGLEMFGVAIGSWLVDKGADVYIDTYVTYNNYYLFSTTTAPAKDDKEQLLSVGLFGKVITFSKNDLVEQIEQLKN